MASIGTIPVEVANEIIKYILYEGPSLPAVGEHAAWATPPDSGIFWRPRLRERLVRSMPWTRDPSDEIPLNNGVTVTRRMRDPTCSLKALRRTNRFFADLCLPVLLRELNLMSDLNLKQVKGMDEILTLPKWSFIQSISVFVDSPVAKNLSEQALSVAYVLEKCQNLITLALYYRSANVQMMLLKDALFKLLKDGRLSTLGFYSYQLLHDFSGRDEKNGQVKGLIDLLDCIAFYEPAQQSLRVLDVVADYIPESTFDLLRSRFTSLNSLTLRRIVRWPWFTNRIWDADQQPKWHSYPSLTRLQLSHFAPAHAAHIPLLVGHFTALEELKISACGNVDNFVPVARKPGWSGHANALCNTHRKLKWLHMEHMDDWEIYELGIIPTATLIVTTVKKHHLLETLRQDAEIFPGLRVLRLAPLPSSDKVIKIDSEDSTPSMDEICKIRNIEIRRDAVAHWTCGCNFSGGY